MFDKIMALPMQVIVFLFSAILYAFLVGKILPRKYLRPVYPTAEMKDRGLKKYVFENGRAVVYRPSVAAQKYIKQYILSANGRDKYIKCQLDPRVSSIRYDVVVFDVNHRVIDTVVVCDPVFTSGVTQATLLPPKTAYVSVVVKAVDNRIVKNGTPMRISRAKVSQFVVWTVILTMVEMLVMKYAAYRFFKALSSYFAFSGIVGALLISLIVGGALSALIVVSALNRDTKLEPPTKS